MSANRLGDIEVQVLLPADKQLPAGEGTVVAGTWVDGWLDRSTWRRSGDRWHALVRYTLTGTRFPFTYLDHFDETSIRRFTPTDAVFPVD